MSKDANTARGAPSRPPYLHALDSDGMKCAPLDDEKYTALDDVKYATLDDGEIRDALDAVGNGKILVANDGVITASALDALDPLDAPRPPTAATTSTRVNMCSDCLVCA